MNVPEFILAAIAANTTWTLAYLALTLGVAALAYLLALTFHLIVIGRLTAGRAMVASIALTLRQPWVLARRHLAPARGRRGRQSTSGIDWLRELFAAP